MTKFTPINPDDAGDLTLFVDSADNRLKFKGHDGNVRKIDMSRAEVEPNPIPVKWVLQEMGLIKGGIRLPLLPMSRQYYETLRGAMKSAAILP